MLIFGFFAGFTGMVVCKGLFVMWTVAANGCRGSCIRVGC